MSLPSLITLDQYKGSVDQYLDSIYNIYLTEVAHANLVFLNKPIKCQFRPATNGKHFGFWHLISEGPNEEDREINFRRTERIKWISYTIKNAHDHQSIKCWENTRRNSTHTLLWLHDHDYLVVLAKREGYFLLKTAYPIEQEHRRRKLRKESQNCLDPRKRLGSLQERPRILYSH